MKYQTGDVISTKSGFLTVMCPIQFEYNKTYRYKAVGGRTLFWLQNMDQSDVFFWDHELEKILTDEEKALQNLQIEQELF